MPDASGKANPGLVVLVVVLIIVIVAVFFFLTDNGVLEDGADIEIDVSGVPAATITAGPVQEPVARS